MLASHCHGIGGGGGLEDWFGFLAYQQSLVI